MGRSTILKYIDKDFIMIIVLIILRTCVSCYFSHCCDKILDKATWWRKGLFWRTVGGFSWLNQFVLCCRKWMRMFAGRSQLKLGQNGVTLGVQRGRHGMRVALTVVQGTQGSWSYCICIRQAQRWVLVFSLLPLFILCILCILLTFRVVFFHLC